MAQRDTWSLSELSLVRQVGAGAASCVYYALCRRTHMPLAVKIYEKAKLSVLNRHQVEREVTIHSSLSHPHILDFYAAFEDDQRIYLLLEFAAGGDLFDEVKRRGGRLSEREVVAGVLVPYLDALSYLHARGVVHRDIKPENTVFTREGVLKVADFGLAVDQGVERPVTRLGTLDYMAPEVLRCPDKQMPADNKGRADLAYGPPVDVWALGVLAFELLVGRPPFGMSCRDDTMRAICAACPPIPDWISPPAASFIAAALNACAEQRPCVITLRQHPWIMRSTAATTAPRASVAAQPHHYASMPPSSGSYSLPAGVSMPLSARAATGHHHPQPFAGTGATISVSAAGLAHAAAAAAAAQQQQQHSAFAAAAGMGLADGGCALTGGAWSSSGAGYSPLVPVQPVFRCLSGITVSHPTWSALPPVPATPPVAPVQGHGHAAGASGAWPQQQAQQQQQPSAGMTVHLSPGAQQQQGGPAVLVPVVVHAQGGLPGSRTASLNDLLDPALTQLVQPSLHSGQQPVSGNAAWPALVHAHAQGPAAAGGSSSGLAVALPRAASMCVPPSRSLASLGQYSNSGGQVYALARNMTTHLNLNASGSAQPGALPAVGQQVQYALSTPRGALAAAAPGTASTMVGYTVGSHMHAHGGAGQAPQQPRRGLGSLSGGPYGAAGHYSSPNAAGQQVVVHGYPQSGPTPVPAGSLNATVVARGPAWPEQPHAVPVPMLNTGAGDASSAWALQQQQQQQQSQVGADGSNSSGMLQWCSVPAGNTDMLSMAPAAPHGLQPVSGSDTSMLLPLDMDMVVLHPQQQQHLLLQDSIQERPAKRPQSLQRSHSVHLVAAQAPQQQPQYVLQSQPVPAAPSSGGLQQQLVTVVQVGQPQAQQHVGPLQAPLHHAASQVQVQVVGGLGGPASARLHPHHVSSSAHHLHHGMGLAERPRAAAMGYWRTDGGGWGPGPDPLAALTTSAPAVQHVTQHMHPVLRSTTGPTALPPASAGHPLHVLQEEQSPTAGQEDAQQAYAQPLAEQLSAQQHAYEQSMQYMQPAQQQQQPQQQQQQQAGLWMDVDAAQLQGSFQAQQLQHELPGGYEDHTDPSGPQSQLVAGPAAAGAASVAPMQQQRSMGMRPEAGEAVVGSSHAAGSQLHRSASGFMARPSLLRMAALNASGTFTASAAGMGMTELLPGSGSGSATASPHPKPTLSVPCAGGGNAEVLLLDGSHRAGMSLQARAAAARGTPHSAARDVFSTKQAFLLSSPADGAYMPDAGSARAACGGSSSASHSQEGLLLGPPAPGNRGTMRLTMVGGTGAANSGTLPLHVSNAGLQQQEAAGGAAISLSRPASARSCVSGQVKRRTPEASHSHEELVAALLARRHAGSTTPLHAGNSAGISAGGVTAGDVHAGRACSPLAVGLLGLAGPGADMGLDSAMGGSEGTPGSVASVDPGSGFSVGGCGTTPTTLCSSTGTTPRAGGLGQHTPSLSRFHVLPTPPASAGPAQSGGQALQPGSMGLGGMAAAQGTPASARMQLAGAMLQYTLQDMQEGHPTALLLQQQQQTGVMGSEGCCGSVPGSPAQLGLVGHASCSMPFGQQPTQQHVQPQAVQQQQQQQQVLQVPRSGSGGRLMARRTSRQHLLQQQQQQEQALLQVQVWDPTSGCLAPEGPEPLPSTVPSPGSCPTAGAGAGTGLSSAASAPQHMLMQLPFGQQPQARAAQAAASMAGRSIGRPTVSAPYPTTAASHAQAQPLQLGSMPDVAELLLVPHVSTHSSSGSGRDAQRLTRLRTAKQPASGTHPGPAHSTPSPPPPSDLLVDHERDLDAPPATRRQVMEQGAPGQKQSSSGTDKRGAGTAGRQSPALPTPSQLPLTQEVLRLRAGHYRSHSGVPYDAATRASLDALQLLDDVSAGSLLAAGLVEPSVFTMGLRAPPGGGSGGSGAHPHGSRSCSGHEVHMGAHGRSRGQERASMRTHAAAHSQYSSGLHHSTSANAVSSAACQAQVCEMQLPSQAGMASDAMQQDVGPQGAGAAPQVHQLAYSAGQAPGMAATGRAIPIPQQQQQHDSGPMLMDCCCLPSAAGNTAGGLEQVAATAGAPASHHDGHDGLSFVQWQMPSHMQLRAVADLNHQPVAGLHMEVGQGTAAVPGAAGCHAAAAAALPAGAVSSLSQPPLLLSTMPSVELPHLSLLALNPSSSSSGRTTSSSLAPVVEHLTEGAAAAADAAAVAAVAAAAAGQHSTAMGPAGQQLPLPAPAFDMQQLHSSSSNSSVVSVVPASMLLRVLQPGVWGSGEHAQQAPSAAAAAHQQQQQHYF